MRSSEDVLEYKLAEAQNSLLQLEADKISRSRDIRILEIICMLTNANNRALTADEKTFVENELGVAGFSAAYNTWSGANKGYNYFRQPRFPLMSELNDTLGTDNKVAFSVATYVSAPTAMKAKLDSAHVKADQAILTTSQAIVDLEVGLKATRQLHLDKTHSKFTVTETGPICEFKRTDIQPAHGKKNSKGEDWKAQISIDSHDMVKAWDLIYPILSRNADLFTVVNPLQSRDYQTACEKRYNDLRKEYDAFVLKCTNNDVSRKDLMDFVILLGEAETPKKFWESKKSFSSPHEAMDDVIDRVDKLMFEQVEAARRERDHSRNVVAGAAQITIAVPAGQEAKYQALLERIEKELLAAQIKPGPAIAEYESVGHYSSIRSSGADAAHDRPNSPFSVSMAKFKVEIYEQIRILETSTTGDTVTKHEAGEHLARLADEFFEISPGAQREHLKSFQNNCVKVLREADRKINVPDNIFSSCCRRICECFSNLWETLVVARHNFGVWRAARNQPAGLLDPLDAAALAGPGAAAAPPAHRAYPGIFTTRHVPQPIDTEVRDVEAKIVGSAKRSGEPKR